MRSLEEINRLNIPMKDLTDAERDLVVKSSLSKFKRQLDNPEFQKQAKKILNPMKSELTKLFRPSIDGVDACAQIHADHYCNTLEHILDMAAHLTNDFPGINRNEIQVARYAGQRIKGITFVEVFLPKETKMPEGYEEIQQIEFIL